jgi:putative inorganic carbon (HCO3(-)) transporter
VGTVHRLRAGHLEHSPVGWLLGAGFAIGVGGLVGLKAAFAFPLLGGLAMLAGVAYLAWHAAPAWTLSAGLVLSVFSGNWDQMGFPAAVAPDRVVLGLGLLAIMLRAPGSRTRPPLYFRPIHWVLLLAVCYATISAVAVGTISQFDSLAQLVERYGVIPFLVFLCAPVAFRTETDRRVLLLALVALGAYLGVDAVLETVGPEALIFPAYINNPDVGILPDRARGPFVEPATFGIALFTCLGACILASTVWRTWTARLALSAVGLSCALGLLFTLTRQVWVATLAGALVAAIANTRIRAYLPVIVVTVGVAVAAAVTTVPGLQEKIDARRSAQRSLWDRGNLNHAAILATLDHPLTGLGWETWTEKNTLYLRQQPNYPLTPVSTLPIHNVFLAYAAQLGIVGLALWLSALLLGVGGSLLRRAPPAVRLWRVLGQSVFAFVLVVVSFEGGQSFSNLIVWFLAAVVIAPSFWAEKDREVT